MRSRDRTFRGLLVFAMLGGFLISTTLGAMVFGRASLPTTKPPAAVPPTGSASENSKASVQLMEAEAALPRLQVSGPGAEPTAAPPSADSVSSPPLAFTAPSTRYGPGMTYDAKDGYVLLFGGESPTGFLSDTWKFEKGKWSELGPSSHPLSRVSRGTVYDAKDGYVLLFGGLDPAVSAAWLNDTWKFEKGSWTELTPPKAPPVRDGPGMAYDAKDGYVLLFGGLGSGEFDLGGTWSFAGGVWTQLSLTTHPGVRAFPGITYDSKDGYVLMFGGAESSGDLSDTWMFVKGTWTELVPSGEPSSRWGVAMIYDAKDGYVVLYGGYSTIGLESDTWTFVKDVWTNITSSTHPSARDRAGISYDSKDE